MRKTYETLQKELKGRAPPQRPHDEGLGAPDAFGDRSYGRQGGGGYRGGGGGFGRGGGYGGGGGRGGRRW